MRLAFALLALVPATVLGAPSQGPVCPQFLIEDGGDPDLELDRVPTVPFNSTCRLQRDVIGLAETFRLPSGITLDCQAHTITPVSTGVLGASDSRSTPELAVLMNAGRVENCAIEGFDHGILAVDSKGAGSSGAPHSEIRGNRVDARFVAIHLMAADNFAIVDNEQLLWRTRGGVGILIQHNSDGVEIRDNEVTGDFSPSVEGAVLLPGPAATGASGPITLSVRNSNPVFKSGHGAIVVSQALGLHPQLFNAVIGGELYQFAGSDSATPDGSFIEDTLVVGNTVTLPADNSTEDGIIVSNTLRTVVRANTIGSELSGANVRQGIRAGSVSGLQPEGSLRQFPGHCVENAGRLCLSDFDCNIPGIDYEEADACALPQPKSVFWQPEDLRFEDNTVHGQFVMAIASVGKNVTIEGNSVLGLLSSGATAGVGIALAGKFPMETAVVRRNKVSDVTTAVRLYSMFQNEPASFFGAKFSQNDFTGYSTAVVSNDAYALKSELSVVGQGNYWGLPCPGFDPASIKTEGGSLQPLVTDSHPYAVPVADLPEELLPETCSGQ